MNTCSYWLGRTFFSGDIRFFGNRSVRRGRKNGWDQFVETSPQGSLFHKWDFLKTVERHSMHRFLPYGVYSGEELRCIFPFFIGRDHGLTVMNSPPPNTQIPYLGPAFD